MIVKKITAKYRENVYTYSKYIASNKLKMLFITSIIVIAVIKCGTHP